MLDTSLLLITSSCKKDPAENFNPISVNTNSLGENNERRNLNGNYSSISYNASENYLVFPDKETFEAAINSLGDEVRDIIYDGGIKNELLDKIRTSNNLGQLKNDLINNSPLSDEVIIELINKNLPDAIKKDILYKNITFSEEVETTFENANVSAIMRSEINTERRKNLSTSSPKLLSFERRFHNYSSLRKKLIEGENSFLAAGNDPENPLNPRYVNGGVDDIIATLINEKGEVKIGSDLLIIHNDKQIVIKGAKKSIVDFVRKTGRIPIVPSPITEPENGLPKSLNPAPIDPSINVMPNEYYNLDCGPVKVETDGVNSNRIVMDSEGTNGPGTQYYWDFGNGFVSYKKNPIHLYTDGLQNHTVTVVISNQLGVTCYPLGNGSSVTSPNGTFSSSLYAYNTIGLTSSFRATTTVPGNNTYEWSFTDNTSASTGLSDNITHTFPSPGTYTAVVNIIHPDGTVTPLNTSVTVDNQNNNNNGSTSGCDRLERNKSEWKYVDNNKKIVHKLELQQFILFQYGRIHLAVNAYKKIGGSDTYFLTRTSCAASYQGIVYREDGTGYNCGITVPTDDEGSQSNTATYDLYHPYGFHPAVSAGSITSSGTAFGTGIYAHCAIKD